ncbi:MAG: DUF814 domain-containing protein [Candidatus Marinimicrobia bacterium]|nr:DUF814 domain-containing protein [Candidatus Neomarinimicrobiota bacterium]
MFNSWYYIREFALNLRQEIVGAVIHTPFTYKKNELYIPIDYPGEYRCFHLVIKPPVPYLSLETSVPKQKQVVKLFKPLQGSIIEEVLFHKDDRQILIAVNGYYLLINGYGINSNFMLLNHEFELIDLFKNRKNVVLPQKEDFISSRKDAEEIDWLKLFREHMDKNVFSFLKFLPAKFFSDNLRMEICYRAGVSSGELIHNLSDLQRSAMISSVRQIQQELKTPQYFFYDLENPVLSLVKMGHLGLETARVEDFFDLQRAYISKAFHGHIFSEQKKALTGKMRKYFEYVEKKLVTNKKALAELPDSTLYRKFGELILIHIRQIQKGQSSLVVTWDTGEIHEIPLDPKLTPAANGDVFFKKALKAEKSKIELKTSIESLSLEKTKIQHLISQLEEVGSLDELRALEEEIPGNILQQNNKEDSNVRVPYKRFVFEGWEILVGKSSRDNDELTFQVASKFDFWFHAYGVSGSHVVVRNPGKKDHLPGQVLRRAAGIAAFFSKSKHATVVPVNYTQKKYVVKRKKMAPGQVNISFEKTIIIEPMDPTGK